MEKEFPVVSETASDGIQAENVNEIKEEVKHHEPETVNYSTHKKLLDQRKSDRLKMQEKDDLIANLQRQKDEAHEAKLLEEKRFQELYEAEKAKAEKAANSVNEMKRSIHDGYKLQAFQNALPGKLANTSYVDYINFDKIKLNEETLEVDEMSVKEVVDEFVTNHPRLYLPKEAHASLPNTAPGEYRTQSFEEAIKACQTQKEFDEVRKKYGRND